MASRRSHFHVDNHGRVRPLPRKHTRTSALHQSSRMYLLLTYALNLWHNNVYSKRQAGRCLDPDKHLHASLGTEDLIWLLPDEQLYKDSICSTVLITTREMYTHPWSFVFLSFFHKIKSNVLSRVLLKLGLAVSEYCSFMLTKAAFICSEIE